MYIAMNVCSSIVLTTFLIWPSGMCRYVCFDHVCLTLGMYVSMYISTVSITKVWSILYFTLDSYLPRLQKSLFKLPGLC